MNVGRSLVRLNQRICLAIEQRLPQAQPNMSRLYERLVTKKMLELGPNLTIVDIGGGQKCAFAELKTSGSRIIAVDASAEELGKNVDADEARVADVTRRLPFGDGEVDMVVSKHALEHLGDVRSFVLEASRVLKPGGGFVHFFPARFAVSAMLNRLLPHWLAETLVHTLLPETRGSERFRAYYDRCYYSGLGSLLRQCGFEVEQMRVSYHESHYFSFFLPLFLLGAFYELMLYVTGPRDLAANLVVVASKGGRGTVEKPH